MSRGDITVKPDPDRDAKLDKIAAHFGMRSMNAFIGVIAAQVARTPHPRYVFRVLGAMEAEIQRIREEERAARNG